MKGKDSSSSTRFCPYFPTSPPVGISHLEGPGVSAVRMGVRLETSQWIAVVREPADGTGEEAERVDAGGRPNNINKGWDKVCE